MLSYDTHDKAEGIIQEYSFHFFPIIVKYLVCCIAIKKHLFVPVWLLKYNPNLKLCYYPYLSSERLETNRIK